MNLLAILMILLVGILSNFLCYKKTNRKLNYGSFYCYLWIVVGVMANSGFMGYYLPSTLINVCICASMFIFGIVYAALGSRTHGSVDYLLEADASIRSRLILICNYVVFVYLLPFFRNAISVISNQGFIYLRMISGSASAELGTTDVNTLILQSICYPVILSSVFIGIVSLFLKSNKSLKILAVSLINLVLYCLTNASRNGFVVVIIIAFFAYFRLLYPLQKQRLRREGRSHKKLLIIISIALVSVIVFISRERSSTSLSAFENAYIYFFGGPSYSTQLMQNLGEYSINGTLLFGSATFGFVYNIVAILGRYFGINIPISDFIINSQLASKVYPISPHVSANAMSTIFFPFLMDWGYLGVVIGPLLIALIAVRVEKLSLSVGNVRWMTLGIYLYYFLYRTIFKYDGVSISFFFLIFFIFLFTSTDKNRKVVLGDYTVI